MGDRNILLDDVKNNINLNISNINNLSFPKENVNLEIEVRFMLNGNNIKRKFFDRLKNIYENYKKERKKDTIEIQNIIDEDRDIQKSYRKNNDEKEFKYKYYKYVDRDKYDIKVDVSAEIKNINTKNVKLDNKKKIRNRDRTTYFLEDGVKLDMTIVDKFKYEVELEINDINKIDLLVKWLDIIWKDLHGSDEIYTISEKREMENYVENILGEPLSYNILNNARQLHFKDIVYGGIVGCINKKYSTDIEEHKIVYSVAHKSDGERKLLIVYKNKIWLINPSFTFNLLQRKDYNILEGSIIDVEYIPPESRLEGAPDIKYWLHGIDLLCVKDDNERISDIRESTRGYRLRELARIVNSLRLIDQDIIEFHLKTNYMCYNPEEFFQVMININNTIPTLNYKTDGFIFTPDNTKYKLADVEAAPMKWRKLSFYPDICKWKPSDRITIDLFYDGKKVYANKKIEIKGYQIKGGDINVVNEYKVSGKTLKYVKSREDKPKANDINVINDDLKSIQENITIEDLAGLNLRLVFKYHNQIKKTLIDKLINKNDYIMDIGFGRGGELSKYKEREVGGIYAVEPNVKNLKEAKERIKSYGMKNVQIINTGGEDYEEITKEVSNGNPEDRVDVVCLMLSLSFFYKSEKMLDGLVKTIENNLKQDGKILFLTIDGDACMEMAHSSIRREEAPKKRITLGNDDYIEFPDKGSREVTIKLSNTILENEGEEGIQKEYLVVISDLTKKLRKIGFNLGEIFRADGERLLPIDGQKYTRLYSYGYYEKNKDDIKYVIKEKEMPKKSKWILVEKHGKIVEKYNDEYYLFTGYKNNYSILHNYYPIKFNTKESFNIDKEEGIDEKQYKWRNVEQYAQMCKADYFEDFDIFTDMEAEKDPNKMKILARKIENYDAEEWDQYSGEVLILGLRYKFDLEEAKEYLLGTGERTIIFCDPYDKELGSYTSIDDIDVNNYEGFNTLGKLLMDRRNKLIKKEKKKEK